MFTIALAVVAVVCEMSARCSGSFEMSLSKADSVKVTWLLTAELLGVFLTPTGVVCLTFKVEGSSEKIVTFSSDV